MKFIAAISLSAVLTSANAESTLFRCEMEVIDGPKHLCRSTPVDLCTLFFEIDPKKKTVIKHSYFGHPNPQTITSWTNRAIHFEEFSAGAENEWSMFKVIKFDRITGVVKELEEYRDGNNEVVPLSGLSALQEEYGVGPFGINFPTFKQGKCIKAKPIL